MVKRNSLQCQDRSKPKTLITKQKTNYISMGSVVFVKYVMPKQLQL